MIEKNKDFKDFIDKVFTVNQFPIVNFSDFTSTEIAIINDENRIVRSNFHSSKTDPEYSKKRVFDYVKLSFDEHFCPKINDDLYPLFYKLDSNEGVRLKDYLKNEESSIEIKFSNLYLKKQFKDNNKEILLFERSLKKFFYNQSMLIRIRVDTVGYDTALNELRQDIKYKKELFVNEIAFNAGLKVEMVNFIIMKNKIKEVSIFDIKDKEFDNPVLDHFNILNAYREYLHKVFDAVCAYKELLEGEK